MLSLLNQRKVLSQLTFQECAYSPNNIFKLLDILRKDFLHCSDPFHIFSDNNLKKRVGNNAFSLGVRRLGLLIGIYQDFMVQ
jgi:hypothetical protein